MNCMAAEVRPAAPRSQADVCEAPANTAAPSAAPRCDVPTVCSVGTGEVQCLGAREGQSIPLPASGLTPTSDEAAALGFP